MAQSHSYLPKSPKRFSKPICYVFRERLLFVLLGIAIGIVIFVAIVSSSLPSQFTQSYVLYPNHNSSELISSMTTKLRQSVTFLPLKDLRYAETNQQGHTWFMSSMYDTHEEGEVQYQKFPSKSSKGRLLCIMGRDGHDGASWNSYGLAFPDALPENATFYPGLTFISNNHYNYGNIWHGLSALFPFVGWHRRVGQCSLPARWILFHWGELRRDMSGWLDTLMKLSCMVATNMPPDLPTEGIILLTFGNALVDVYAIAAIEPGKQLHCYSVKSGLGSWISLSNALVDLYEKCGNINDNQRAFFEILDPNVVSWNVLNVVWAAVKPDHITMLLVLYT